MTAREALARIIYEDAAMNELGFTQARTFAANSVDSPEQDQPFIVVNTDFTEKAFGGVGSTTVSYWVHWPRAKGRDYSTIDNALIRIKEILLDAEHVAGSDGWILTAASWIDTSRDLVDESYNTLTKYITFRVANRSAVTS